MARGVSKDPRENGGQTVARRDRNHFRAEAELWWQRETEKPVGRWTYFRRHVATTGVEAARRVEADFREWVEGQLEATDTE
jgi:hypothetical protein